MVGRDSLEKSIQAPVLMDLYLKVVILVPPKIPPFQPLDEAAEHGPIALVFDLYIDFDNLSTYSTGIFEVRSGGNDFAGRTVFADGDPFSLTPSTIAPYALDLRRTGENQDGTTFEIYVRLIPVNDGQSFLVVTSFDTGTPYSGVCQKI